MRDTDAALPRKPPLIVTPPVAAAFTLAILAIIIGFIVWDAFSRRGEALAAQQQRAAWSARLAAGQAERQLGFLAQALDAQLARGLPATPEVLLRTVLAAEPVPDAAMLWDAEGRLLAAAGPAADAGTLLFAAAAASGSAGFRIAGAMSGAGDAAHPVLFAARWTAPRETDGARLLAVIIDPARIVGTFALPLPRADDVAALALPDGTLLGAPGPHGGAVPDRLRQHMAGAEAGSLQGVAWPDGVVRSTAFQRLSRLELVAVVGASEAAADEVFDRALARNPSARITVILLVATVGIALVRRTRHQHHLLQRIALWEQAAEANPHAVIILDARQPDLPVTYANPALTALTGLDRGEAVGRPLALLAAPAGDADTTARLANALAEGAAFHGEVGARRADDGACITLHVDLHPVHDARGRLLNFICRFQDFTERRQAAQAERAAQMARDWALDELRKALDRIATSEGRFRDFAASASDWFWETDADGRIVWLSDNARQLPGWRVGEAPPLPQLRGAGGAPPVGFRGARIAGQGEAGALVLEVSGRPVAAADGGSLGFRGVVKDITEQEQASARARRDELRLAAAVEHLPIGLLVVDVDDRVLLCNARFCDLFEVDRPLRGEGSAGLTRQVIARLHEQFDAATVNALIAERRRLTAAGRGTMIVPWLDGRTYRLEERRHAGGDRTVVVVDVTELEESRARLLDAVQNITSGFAIFDVGGRLVLGNQPFYDHVQALLPGMAIDDASATALFGGLAAAGALRLMQIDGRAASPEEIATRVELATGDPFLMTTADGRALQVRLRQSGDGGRVVIFSDVSLLRQMDAALRSSEAKFRGLAQASGDGIVIVDPSGEIQFANNEARRMFGYEEDDSGLDRIDGLIADDSQGGPAGSPLARLFAERRSRTLESGRPLRATRRDGTTFPAEVALSYYETPDGPLAQATIRDVTLRLRAEEAERQRAKMVALGTLAGGIAHDLNNALVPILSLSELLLDSGTASAEDAEMLGTIVAAAERARDLVRNILAFSRRGVRNVTTLDLGAVVAKDMPMLRAAIPASIALDYRPPDAPVPVAADETNLHQVVVNLVSNAAQAIGTKVGSIVITVAAVEQPAPGAGGPPSGRHARLEISDTGPGMDEETRQRLFEPFFTTKPVGEGTGLGLAIVHGIVGSHGGTISVESAPGRGTRFTIWLPLRLAEAGA